MRKTNMKKLICIMVTFVMALGLFTGCGATADSKSTGNN